MKTLIQNIITNSKDSKILRIDIFEYFRTNEDIKRRDISKALNELINEKKVYAKLVNGENYGVTEYSLTQEWKEALIY